MGKNAKTTLCRGFERNFASPAMLTLERAEGVQIDPLSL